MRLLLSSVVALSVSGCMESRDLPDTDDIGASRGAALFARDCAACHGADARGPAGPDLTTLTARAGGTFPRQYAMATIDGLGRHGDADAAMPEFGARDMGQTVIVEHDGIGTPVPADLLALTSFLESIQR